VEPVACDVLAQKYFRKAGVPTALKARRRGRASDSCGARRPEGSETRGENRQEVFDRLAGHLAYWAGRAAISIRGRCVRLQDELAYMLATQKAAPNSPQWFNTGLHWATASMAKPGSLLFDHRPAG